MELTFATKELRDLCLSDYLARQEYGDAFAEKLKARLADLSAVSVASDLFMLPGKPRELTGDREGQMVLNLIDEHDLIFQSGHTQKRVLESGNVDWARIRRVQLLGVEKRT